MGERSLVKAFHDEVFAASQVKEFIFPQFHYDRLSLFVRPKHSGAGVAMTVDIQLEVAGVFSNLDGATGGSAQMNEIFVFTNEDVHGRMKAKITAGLTAPDQNVDIELWGWRN